MRTRPYEAVDEDFEDDEESCDCARCCFHCYAGTFGVFASFYYTTCICCCCISIVIGIGAFWLAISRNLNCDAADLQGVVPPYNGSLMPREVILSEYWNQGWQWTKQIDVHDPNQNMARIGYFYDMNFLTFMRFGYSDASNRIWFEAQRPYFYGAHDFSNWWRRYVYKEDHYYLQKCNGGSVYNVDEDTTLRPWWCQHVCMKILNVRKQLPNLQVPAIPEARVHFNYTIQWYFNGFLTTPAWNMLMYDPRTNATLATARQFFSLKNYWMSFRQRYISHWNVSITSNETNLPDWVIIFMAALDDIDEMSHTKGHR